MTSGPGVEWPDEDIDEYVLTPGIVGQGSIRAVARGRDDASYSVCMDDPDNADGLPRWYPITRDALREAAGGVISGRHEVRGRVREKIQRNNIDPEAIDALIQIAAYGSVVY